MLNFYRYVIELANGDIYTSNDLKTLFKRVMSMYRYAIRINDEYNVLWFNDIVDTTTGKKVVYYIDFLDSLNK